MSDMTLEEMQKLAIEQAIGEVAGFVMEAHEEIGEPLARKAAERAVLEQAHLANTVLRDMVEPDARAELPVWGYTISRGKQLGRVLVEKDPREIVDDIQRVSHFTNTLALVSAPAARAVLYALGYNIDWHQSKGQKKSSIIVG